MGFQNLIPQQKINFNAVGSLHLYTDGSCLRNGAKDAPCGWAYVLVQRNDSDKDFEGHGGCCGGTNNQMEMTAVLRGLQRISAVTTELPVTVYSDSTYVIETLKGNFQIKKNIELWNKLFAEARKFSKIRYVWIKGHAGNDYNVRVDRLANAEAQKYDKH